MNIDEVAGNVPYTLVPSEFPILGRVKKSFADLILVTVLLSGSHYLP
jgi:hypothetical protein